MKWNFYKRSLSLVGDVNLARLSPIFFLAYEFLFLCLGLLEMLSAMEHAEIFVSILSQFQI